MVVTNMSDFRNNMKKYLDQITQDHKTVIMSRSNDQAVVMISLEEYNSIKETQYLLSTKANREHLLTSIEDAQGSTIINNVEDLCD
jgi:antitoxin YefM